MTIFITLRGLIAQAEQEQVRLQAEIDRLTNTFVLGDGTRAQFLGDGGFREPFPFCYESEFYPGSMPVEQRRTTPVNPDYVLATTMPRWRAKYPNTPRWSADIEWMFSSTSDGGQAVTTAEVPLILPAYRSARKYLGPNSKLGSYGLPPRFGTGRDPAAVRAQIEVLRPILDLLDEAHIALYPIYEDIERSRTYIRENIAMARWAMPGKKVYVIGWPAWHNNVNPNGADPSKPMPGTPVSPAWWRMLMEESLLGADGFVIWLKAAAPKPHDEPWWIETLRFVAALRSR